MNRLFLSTLVFLSIACGVAEARGPHYSYHRSAYSGGFGSHIGYGAGGYYGPGFYQPWSSFTYPSPSGGAITQFYGGTFVPWG